MSRTYTTKNGYVIETQPFPQLLPSKIELAARKKAQELYPAAAPTYSVELMGGGTQTFEHDDKSVQTDEERASLATYQEAKAKQTAHVNEKMMQFYMLKGTKVRLPANEEWLQTQEFFGVEIPTDPNERLYHYITTELLSDAEDIMDLVATIMQEAGIDQDTLDAARASFRGALGKEAGAADTAGPVDRGEPTTEPRFEVVDIATIQRNGVYEGMALDTVALG